MRTVKAEELFETLPENEQRKLEIQNEVEELKNSLTSLSTEIKVLNSRAKRLRELIDQDKVKLKAILPKIADQSQYKKAVSLKQRILKYREELDIVPEKRSELFKKKEPVRQALNKLNEELFQITLRERRDVAIEFADVLDL